jgi:membrane associated rhomboid family serine protease
MPRYGATPFAFPEFGGATRRLILINLGAFFVALLLSFVPTLLALFTPRGTEISLLGIFGFDPAGFLDGRLWQPFTYSLVHPTLVGTLFELLSLWFLAGFLESDRAGNWVTGLYCVSVLGTAAAALALYACAHALGYPVTGQPLIGCFGGIFGLLAAIGVLYGDVQFQLFFVIGIKARYLVAIYALISIAVLFGDQRMYAFAQLGGAVAGLLWVRRAPRKGVSFAASEGWYGLRNRYYRWKRRRAARKFEVYMRQHGRTVRFDGNGRPIHDDDEDKSRWN